MTHARNPESWLVIIGAYTFVALMWALAFAAWAFLIVDRAITCERGRDSCGLTEARLLGTEETARFPLSQLASVTSVQLRGSTSGGKTSPGASCAVLAMKDGTQLEICPNIRRPFVEELNRFLVTPSQGTCRVTAPSEGSDYVMPLVPVLFSLLPLVGGSAALFRKVRAPALP